MRTIGEVPRINAKYYPDKKALIDSSREFTWGMVNERSNRLANALTNLGCKKGERVAILSYNSSEFVESILPAQKQV